MNNYRQRHHRHRRQGARSLFRAEQFLADERVYLETRVTEPPEMTQNIEYVEALLLMQDEMYDSNRDLSVKFPTDTPASHVSQEEGICCEGQASEDGHAL